MTKNKKRWANILTLSLEDSEHNERKDMVAGKYSRKGKDKIQGKYQHAILYELLKLELNNMYEKERDAN